jgi:hypothetical protein
LISIIVGYLLKLPFPLQGIVANLNLERAQLIGALQEHRQMNAALQMSLWYF